MPAVFAYVTAASTEEAQAIGRALVEERLAACVNILPGMVSIYPWAGRVERADEVVALIKTRRALGEQVARRVRDLHSYDLPAILIVPLAGVDPAYAGWLLANTSDQ